MILSNSFKQTVDKNTGRKLIQLTQGEGTCYPLYYFISSITKDEKYIIYHMAKDNEVQLYRLSLQTGKSTQLTYCTCANTVWYPWCVDKGKGVLDHRSVLNVVTNKVIYFDDTTVRQVDVETLEDEILFTLPKNRIAIGQNCVTTDGKYFVYIHHDEKLFDDIIKCTDHHLQRSLSKNTALCAYNLETRENRDLLFINSPIHHVIPLDEKHVVFCHPATENAMLLTDVNGGYYTHMHTQNKHGGCVCHYLTSDKGIMYEVLGSNNNKVYSGIYNPSNNKHYEFTMPDYFGYTHTGADSEGRLWFYENHNRSENIHNIYFLQEHNPTTGDIWVELLSNNDTYNGGQSSHFHPRITPDRQWLLYTGGDSKSQSNHLFLMDISDLEDTKGIPTV